MINQFPFEFSLNDGTNVVVNTPNTIVYHFDVKDNLGSDFKFDWHVFRGIERQPMEQIKVIEAYQQLNA